MKVPFHKPYSSKFGSSQLLDLLSSNEISSEGIYTQKCRTFFEDRYGFKNSYLTTSCTSALEMAALCIGIKEGDEVIFPSYTYVSTVNAFLLKGAIPVFCDSSPAYPVMDSTLLEGLITEKTKAIVIVHYNGVSPEINTIIDLTKKYKLALIEDAAQALDGYYIDEEKGDQPLGSFGDFAAFSFHYTKNLSCGEGGLLVINNEQYLKQADFIWNKGTDRSDFNKGLVPFYSWQCIGGSFQLSEYLAAILYEQLLNLDDVQEKRKKIFERYSNAFSALKIHLQTPNYAKHNAHLYFICCKNEEEREQLRLFLNEKGIQSFFHYQALHLSPFFKNNYPNITLKESEFFSASVLRLPLFPDLSKKEQDYVIDSVKEFFTV